MQKYVIRILLLFICMWAFCGTDVQAQECDHIPGYVTQLENVEDFNCLARLTRNQDFINLILARLDYHENCLPDVIYGLGGWQHWNVMSWYGDDHDPDCIDISTEEHNALRNSNELVLGYITRMPHPSTGEEVYAVIVTTRVEDIEVMLDVFAQLRASFNEEALGGRLVLFTRLGTDQATIAADWLDDPRLNFDIIISNTQNLPPYIPYSRTTNYGYVKIFHTLADLDNAINQGEISWQNIVVSRYAPFDIPTVVAGVITGEPQVEGGHIMVRSINRETPDAYVEDALDELKFGLLEGKLIRLTVGEENYEVEIIDENDETALLEVQAWWHAHRPDLSGSLGVTMQNTDLVYTGLDSIQDPAIVPDVARHGGKGANLMKLWQSLPDDYKQYIVPGFIIPFSAFEATLSRGNMHDIIDFPDWQSDDDDVADQQIATRDFIDKMLANDRFNTDPTYRTQILDHLQSDGIERRHTYDNTQNDRANTILGDLRDRIHTIFDVYDDQGVLLTPGEEVMVRFRSSSNTEDVLEFNGAGLYRSKSTCAADSFDNGSAGPSQCNPDEDDEENIQEGLRDVFRSLFGFRAWEEREYYQIPQNLAKMAILVTPAFLSEDSNGVAFTGNPFDIEDKRYVVTVQKGDTSVVSAELGILPEKVILNMSIAGEVIQINRVLRSSLSSPTDETDVVLTDAQYEELGRVLYMIDTHFEIDPEGHDPNRIIKDVEFKFDDGRLWVKQVRPLLVKPFKFELPIFVRGDVNNDHKITIYDIINMLQFLFLGTATVDCLDTADINDNGTLDISDVIFFSNYLFQKIGSIPEPHPAAGIDFTFDDGIGCEVYFP